MLPSCNMCGLIALTLSLSVGAFEFSNFHSQAAGSTPANMIPMMTSMDYDPTKHEANRMKTSDCDRCSHSCATTQCLSPSSTTHLIAPPTCFRSHNSLCSGPLLKTFQKKLRYGTGLRQMALSRVLQAREPITSWVSSGAPGTNSSITKCRSRACAASVSSASSILLLVQDSLPFISLFTLTMTRSHTLTITCTCCHPAGCRLPGIQQANQALY